MKTIKFNLSRSFKMIPEGERVLTITECSPSPSGNPTAIKMSYSDVDGGTLNESINLDKALWKISRICECVLNTKDGEEMSIDDMCRELKGKKIKVEIVHRDGTTPREDGTVPKFANISKIISGVEEEEPALPTTMSYTPSENPRSSILAGL